MDDNRHMRTLIAEVLRSLGARLVFAPDAAAALRTLQEVPIDVVMTDLAMPPLDGIELVRRIRSGPSATSMTPIIMLTSQATYARVAEARDAGVTEFVSKPLVIKTLLERLHAAIHHPRPFIRTDAYFGPDRRRRSEPDYHGPMRRQGDGR